MAGYCGYTKSNNALAAEAEDKLPLTRAVAALAERAGVKRRLAREVLMARGACEWHHTSKRYNRTDYYDVAAASRWLRWAPQRDEFDRSWRAAAAAAHKGFSGDAAHARTMPIFEAAAAAMSLTVEQVRALYYRCEDEGEGEA